MFRSPAAVAIWYAWLVFAALNLVDLAVRGHDHTSAVIAAVLLLITGVLFVAALRPRIIADGETVTLRNPMRDIRVPWGSVTGIDLHEVVRVYCRVQTVDPARGAQARQRVLRSWALQASPRGRMKGQIRARARAAAVTRTNPGFAHVPADVQALTAQSAAARAVTELDELRSGAAEHGAPAGPPAVTWSMASAVALLLPALVLAVVSVMT